MRSHTHAAASRDGLLWCFAQAGWKLARNHHPPPLNRQLVGRDEPLRVVFVNARWVLHPGQNVGFCYAGVGLSGKGRRVLLATGMRVILPKACAERVHVRASSIRRADALASFSAWLLPSSVYSGISLGPGFSRAQTIADQIIRSSVPGLTCGSVRVVHNWTVFHVSPVSSLPPHSPQ